MKRKKAERNETKRKSRGRKNKPTTNQTGKGPPKTKGSWRSLQLFPPTYSPKMRVNSRAYLQYCNQWCFSCVSSVLHGQGARIAGHAHSPTPVPSSHQVLDRKPGTSMTSYLDFRRNPCTRVTSLMFDTSHVPQLGG